MPSLHRDMRQADIAAFSILTPQTIAPLARTLPAADLVNKLAAEIQQSWPDHCSNLKKIVVAHGPPSGHSA
jgi:hypothetical protein